MRTLLPRPFRLSRLPFLFLLFVPPSARAQAQDWARLAVAANFISPDPSLCRKAALAACLKKP